MTNSKRVLHFYNICLNIHKKIIRGIYINIYHSHEYHRFSSPPNKGISTNYNIFCARTGIFDHSSWIEQNWNWKKPCGLKRLGEEFMGGGGAKIF